MSTRLDEARSLSQQKVEAKGLVLQILHTVKRTENPLSFLLTLAFLHAYEDFASVGGTLIHPCGKPIFFSSVEKFHKTWKKFFAPNPNIPFMKPGFLLFEFLS